MTVSPRYLCRVCGTPHERRNRAVECCSEGETLSPEELEAIGQARLFDDGEPAMRPVAVEENGQQQLF